MKNFIIAALLLVASAASLSAAGRWLGKEHSFGVIAEDGGTVYCDFYLVNDGSELMSIIDVRANCGCTRPEYSPAPIAPGDTAVIHVGFLPEGRPGQFVKRVSVDCDVEPLRSSLTISGTVVGSAATLRSRFPMEIGPVRLRSSMINYGKIYRGDTKGQSLECINASADTLRPRVADVPRYLTALVEPAVVPPGERFIIATVFKSSLTDAWGALEGSFKFYPDAAPSAEPLEIRTVAILAEDFSKLSPQELRDAPVIDVTPMAVDLEQLQTGRGKLTRSVTVKNTGRSVLIVRDVASSDPAVTAKIKDTKIKPGKSTRLDVTVDTDLLGDKRLLNARISITANAPDDPVTTVRVVAELK